MPEHYASPFRPGHGVRPLVLGGHAELLTRLQAVFDHGDFAGLHAVLLAGVRGSGKTSMLSEITARAEDKGWITMETTASKGFSDRLASSTVPKKINELDNPARLRLKSISLSLHRMLELGLEQTPERKAVDTLASDLVTLGAVHPDRGILIDKLVTGPQLTFMQRARTEQFYLFDYDETKRVLDQTAARGGRSVDPEALDYMAAASQGNPYLIQLVGDEAWRHDVEAPTIDMSSAQEGARRMMARIENEVLNSTVQDLSEKDREFIDALAAEPEGPVKIGTIVGAMGKSSQYVEQYRLRLINSGCVIPVDSDGSLRHPDERGAGYVAFALPHLRSYVRKLNEGLLPSTPAMNRGHSPSPPVELA